jgi:hypothetical protein
VTINCMVRDAFLSITQSLRDMLQDFTV